MILSCLQLDLNLAISGLMLDSPETALNSANAAIELDPSNAKGYYRKYQALEALDRFEEALECLLAAKKIEPKNKDVKKAITKVSLKCEVTRSKQAVVVILAKASETSSCWYVSMS